MNDLLTAATVKPTPTSLSSHENQNAEYQLRVAQHIRQYALQVA